MPRLGLIINLCAVPQEAGPTTRCWHKAHQGCHCCIGKSVNSPSKYLPLAKIIDPGIKHPDVAAFRKDAVNHHTCAVVFSLCYVPKRVKWLYH